MTAAPGELNSIKLAPAKLEKLGGDRKGGVLEIDPSAGPLLEGMILSDDVSADVLATIQAGQFKLGVLEIDPQKAAERGSRSYALVGLDGISGDPEDVSALTPMRYEDQKIFGAGLRADGSEVTIGRSPKNITSGLEAFGFDRDGYMSAMQMGITINPDTGRVTIVDKNSSNGTTVTARQLESADIDDTVDVDDMTQPRAELLDTLVSPEVEEAEAIHKVGEVAIADEVIIDELPVMDNQEDAVTVEEIAPKVEVSPRMQELAMTELKEDWGMPESTTVEQAVKLMDSQADQLIEAARALKNFEEVRGNAIKGINDSEKRGWVPLLGGKTRQRMAGAFAKDLKVLASLSPEAALLLPRTLREKVTGVGEMLARMDKDFTRLNSMGPNWIRETEAISLRKDLRKLPDTSEAITRSLRRVQEMQLDLKGYMTEMPEEAEASKEEIKYRNERVQKWAEELSAGEISQERLDEITAEMKNAVEIESGMDGDPNSPYQWFGDRVRDNDPKGRSAVNVSGRSPGTGDAHTYVAEMMTDMMRGKFDVSNNGYNEPIELSRDSVGGIATGQHRAAALAMLYGNNNWQKIATSLGFRIREKE